MQRSGSLYGHSMSRTTESVCVPLSPRPVRTVDTPKSPEEGDKGKEGLRDDVRPNVVDISFFERLRSK